MLSAKVDEHAPTPKADKYTCESLLQLRFSQPQLQSRFDIDRSPSTLHGAYSIAGPSHQFRRGPKGKAQLNLECFSIFELPGINLGSRLNLAGAGLSSHA